MPRLFSFLVIWLATLFVATAGAAELRLDERPAVVGEWGYHPSANAVLHVTPPRFTWRPQSKIARWQLECHALGGNKFSYTATVTAMNVHCPPQIFPPGRYTWRYRGVDSKGRRTNWSTSRIFRIAENAVQMPMPKRAELLARIPDQHPRLFVRPEDLPRLRRLARGPLHRQFQQLVAECERLVAKPPPTKEPPKYPPGTVGNSESWRKIWWGNRTYTIRALNGAATLAFTRLLGGDEKYGQLAKRILMDCARWDPKGATGYRYNDEAGMPYAYYFSRTYSFVHDLLSEQERVQCQRVMKIRGEEMYHHLYPRHLWRPYASHSNRAWHFLGEIAVAFHGEIKEADDWAWFAMNVFYNVYPVWADKDGGWHEGSEYWSSYIRRFTWWADVMRTTFRVNAYRKPYFSQIGYYPMYLLPPGKRGGGFGDLTARMTAARVVPLISQCAAQAGNGHWQWYVEQMGRPVSSGGYIGFVRGGLPAVEPVPPGDLPVSRLFRGTGQAMLNTTLRDAADDVQVVFKSSPFGTQSHGYEANNSFLLWAYGQRLLIRSGYRDTYGSKHHRLWMWSTRSVNNITVDGHGQLSHSAQCQGKIVAFHTDAEIDAVVGEAGATYRDSIKEPSRLKRFTRSILFVKPDLVVVYDQLVAKRPSTYQYWLHATKKFAVHDQKQIDLKVGKVNCKIALLAPAGLTFAQTNQYDPNPRPRITLREWHLTATTPAKKKQLEFIGVFRPYRAGDSIPTACHLQHVSGGYILTGSVGHDDVTILLPRSDTGTVSRGILKTTGRIAIARKTAAGARHVVKVERLQ